MFDKVLDEKTVQVSFVSGIVFFLLANQPVLKFVEDLLKKCINVKLTGNMLLLLHSVVFAVLVGVISFYVYQPVRAQLNNMFFLHEGQAPSDNPCGPGMTFDTSSQECVVDPNPPMDAPPSPDDAGYGIPKNTTPLSPCVNYDPNIPGSGNAQCMDGEMCAGDASGSGMCVPMVPPTGDAPPASPDEPPLVV
tara:strand:+ start:195 stop:770 length:576 start_codon:yes stop_codon:yes gene_type:complete